MATLTKDWQWCGQKLDDSDIKTEERNEIVDKDDSLISVWVSKKKDWGVVVAKEVLIV